MISPSFPAEFVTILLSELLFGLGFNLLVVWAHKNNIWHVSVSVSLGVAVTLMIPVAIWYDVTFKFWQVILIVLICFVASGIPMITGSTKRTVEKENNHKRREWPNAARQVRDEVVMELSMMAYEISTDAKEGKLKAGDLPEIVQRLHMLISTLKSV